MDQQLEHYYQGLSEICDNSDMALQKSLKDQEHPLCIPATDGQFYNICELAENYYKAKVQKQKMTAEIMKFEFNPHLKNILVQIGAGNFKGKSKAKAAEKILSFVRENCECGFLMWRECPNASVVNRYAMIIIMKVMNYDWCVKINNWFPKNVTLPNQSINR